MSIKYVSFLNNTYQLDIYNSSTFITIVLTSNLKNIFCFKKSTTPIEVDHKVGCLCQLSYVIIKHNDILIYMLVNQTLYNFTMMHNFVRYTCILCKANRHK